MNRIKELRKNKHITQGELADYLGISTQAISLYERSEREPKLATWQKLADFFDVSVSYLQGQIVIDLDDLSDDLNTSNSDTPEELIEAFKSLPNWKQHVSNLFAPLKVATNSMKSFNLQEKIEGQTKVQSTKEAKNKAEKLQELLAEDTLKQFQYDYVTEAITLLLLNDFQATYFIKKLIYYLNIAISDPTVFEDETFKPGMIEMFAEGLDKIDPLTPNNTEKNATSEEKDK